MVDDYTTLVWQPLCREVAKLQIGLPMREQVPVTKSAIFLGPDSNLVTGRVTGGGPETQNPSQGPDFGQDFARGFLRGGRDLNPRPPA